MNFKNYNTTIISFLISLINGFIISFILFVYNCELKKLIFYSLLAMIFIFFICFNIIENILDKKIKNIYKLILNTKVNKKEKFIMQNTSPKKNIIQVEEDIRIWAKREEEELEFYKKLATFKKEFLQNISHEIKTPLFSIQAYCENLEIELNKKKYDKKILKQFIEVILKNIYRLNNLTSDINLILLLEDKNIQLNKTIFCLEYLISDVIEDLKFNIENKNVEIVFLKSKTEIYADRDKIKQVLINLIENSIKHNKAKTKIHFNVENINNQNIILEIIDNGIGIEDKHLNRIFERFYRADDNRSREVGGTGLGLSICKHIMELHNSFIHVRSKINVGTTFVLGFKKN